MNGAALLLSGVCLLAAEYGGAAMALKPDLQKEALIQIGVEVVEVDEQKMKSLGIQWLNSLRVEESAAPPVFQWGSFTRGRLLADLQALINDGAADLLANPKLVTRNGTTATFHAGGELPYATQSGTSGSVSVEFKSYGVNLKIHPRLVPDNRIALAVNAEVSGPDVQNSVTLSGNIVPGIRSRQVSSELTMDPGSTLTMAGLLQNQKQWVRTGVPGLMYIPLLGRLFSHKVEKTQRTSVVVFITPSLLAAGDATPKSSGDGASPVSKSSEAKAAPPDELLEALDAKEKHQGS